MWDHVKAVLFGIPIMVAVVAFFVGIELMHKLHPEYILIVVGGALFLGLSYAAGCVVMAYREDRKRSKGVEWNAD